MFSFSPPKKARGRPGHRRRLSTSTPMNCTASEAKDVGVVVSIFQKVCVNGELTEDLCLNFLNRVFGPARKDDPHRLQELKDFIHQARSEHSSTIFRTVVTAGSLKNYLLKEEGQNLKRFAKSIKKARNKRRKEARRQSMDQNAFLSALAEDEIGYACVDCHSRFRGWKHCLSHIKDSNHMKETKNKSQLKRLCKAQFKTSGGQTGFSLQSEAKTQRQRSGEPGFACADCGERFNGWDNCLGHLKREDHMNARDGTRGLYKRCQREFPKPSEARPLEASVGYRCLQCAETYDRWRTMLNHQRQTKHAGDKEQCHFFWSQSNNAASAI